MFRDIRPLTLDDLPELSRFLTAGFHTLPDADFAATDVLRWKYLEPPEATAHGSDASSGVPQSYVARDDAGRIIGHIGICRTAFEGRASTVAGGRVGTIHIIDWLGSPDHRAVGMSLMRKAHEGVPTQFGLGVSQAALVVGERAGYELRSLVPVYARVLRTRYWLRTGGLGLFQRAIRIAYGLIRRWTQRSRSSRATITLKQVSCFGDEISSIIEKAKADVVLTCRDPARVNQLLRFPRQAMSGWHLLDGTGRLRGFALLNLIPKDQGQTLTGKVVDCLLDDVDADLWHAAMQALTRELMCQGADIAQAYASTPWTVEALERSGYKSRYSAKFHIRDRQGLISHEAIFHLTPLEGDYAYT
ncbi:MAG TPA: acetyltransferase [Isosphaeraceae bacterium]|nr:acetyltransferase [Isosphaeraceae bacterium]